MAVDKNAVREGTRWYFDGQEVVVQEVTSKSIVYLGDDCGLGLVAIADFLIRAADPAISRHERVMKRFSRLVGRDPGDEIGSAILYLLERVGPPLPPYVEPVAPAPTVVPLPASAMPELAETYTIPAAICAVAEPEPTEDYAIAMPELEPLREDEPRSLKRRRF